MENSTIKQPFTGLLIDHGIDVDVKKEEDYNVSECDYNSNVSSIDPNQRLDTVKVEYVTMEDYDLIKTEIKGDQLLANSLTITGKSSDDNFIEFPVFNNKVEETESKDIKDPLGNHRLNYDVMTIDNWFEERKLTKTESNGDDVLNTELKGDDLIQTELNEDELPANLLRKREKSPDDVFIQVKALPFAVTNIKAEEIESVDEKYSLRNHCLNNNITTITDCFVKLEKLEDTFHSGRLHQTTDDVQLDNCLNHKKHNVKGELPEGAGQPDVARSGMVTMDGECQMSQINGAPISDGQDKLFEEPIDYELETVSFDQFYQDMCADNEQLCDLEFSNSSVDANTDYSGSTQVLPKVNSRKSREENRIVHYGSKKKTCKAGSQNSIVNSDESGRGASCSMCQKTFHHKKELISHIKDIHDNGHLKPYQCSTCQKTFYRMKELQIHLPTHDRKGKVRIRCLVCGLDFENSVERKKHVRAQHPGYSCPTCQVSCRVKSELRVHMRIHSGERPYSCSICDKKFREKGKLTKHMRIHTGEKRFFCTVCQKGFGDKYKMKRHMITHNEKRVKNLILGIGQDL